MSVKTTINIKKSLSVKIIAIASEYNVSISFIINSLARKAMQYYAHKSRVFQRVRYQERLSEDFDAWRRMAISFFPDVYEKCLDLRKLSKVSVSFFLSLAIVKFLDELVEELKIGKVSDNYSANYMLFHTQLGYFNHISLVWDILSPEKMVKLAEIHTE